MEQKATHDAQADVDTSHAPIAPITTPLVCGAPCGVTGNQETNAQQENEDVSNR
jgi:hypothetical protein